MTVITLTTDFGLADPYVGLMKGAIYAVAPEATVVDLSHDIPPQDVLAGALILESVLDVFAPGNIHVAVADPGVGMAKGAIVVETGRDLWVGPDNGVFTAVLQKEKPVRTVALTNGEYHRSVVSDTFYGRDILRPLRDISPMVLRWKTWVSPSTNLSSWRCLNRTIAQVILTFRH